MSLVKSWVLNWKTVVNGYDNKLSLHLGKTESVMFGSKRKLNKVKDSIVQCNGNAKKLQKSVKYLGVQLDNAIWCFYCE